jgi:hypothetical protein
MKNKPGLKITLLLIVIFLPLFIFQFEFEDSIRLIVVLISSMTAILLWFRNTLGRFLFTMFFLSSVSLSITYLARLIIPEADYSINPFTNEKQGVQDNTDIICLILGLIIGILLTLGYRRRIETAEKEEFIPTLVFSLVSVYFLLIRH